MVSPGKKFGETVMQLLLGWHAQTFKICGCCNHQIWQLWFL